MQFLTDLAVTLLTAYLAFTNNLAEKILSLIPEEPVELVAETEVESSYLSDLNPLPSIFGSVKFPDILLRSADYQKASVIESQVENFTITEPALALANIFCTFTTATEIRTTTGTGFFIHSDGVIITNAHVAQYLLLGATDALGDADCVIRQGTPATPKYQAQLLYIPPTWVQENASLIDDLAPTGTGERDYALLYVSGTVDGSPLPERFPALKVNSDLMPRSITGSIVTAAGYPATDLMRNGYNSPLYSVVATTTISELYTFGSNYADVFSIRGSQVGAEGSSGGPILNSKGEVIGMIATRGDDVADGAGSLRAITTSHIHRTILEETGFSLESNTQGNLAFRSNIFTNTLAPFLAGLLSNELAN